MRRKTKNGIFTVKILNLVAEIAGSGFRFDGSPIL